MSDPVFSPQDYLVAHDIVRSLAENLAIQFQMEGEKFDREKMQKHVNTRAALIIVQGLLLDEGERLLK